ncbi:MAG: hypothetical protein HFE47_07115 [Clostridia bacterium]|nr:hypothetical protein [Clostridia bacterium]
MAAKAVAEEYGIKKVYMPALACHSMFEAFQELGYTVIFYPIDSSFDYVLNEENYNQCLVFFMLYYGVTDVGKIDNFIKKHKNCITLVDITHSIWDSHTYNMKADILVGSVRKSIGVVNGGIFLSDAIDITPNMGVNEFTHLRQKAFATKLLYESESDLRYKDAFRLLFSEAEQSLQIKGYAANQESIDSIMKVNAEYIRRKREANYKILYEELKEITDINILSEKMKKESIPFSLPITISGRQSFQKKLAEKGVYAPVLWPITEQQKEVCAFSRYVEENMLSLPIDQRYNIEDMKNIAERVREVVYERR